MEPTASATIPAQSAKRRMGCGTLLFIGFLLLLAIGFLIPPFGGIQEKARVMEACNNGRQILNFLQSYAADHNGQFPSGTTANDAFREFFKAGMLDDERVFTAAFSPYEPDNIIGEAPDYEDALQAGENHWAMTKGLTSQSAKDTPLIFENPALSSWPPFWNTEAAAVKEPGRVWKSQRIIIGRVDGSIQAEPLGPKIGPHATLAPIKDGKNLFDLAGPHEVMDVAR